MIRQKEIKITQFADNTTIILHGTEDSLQAALNVLEVFGNISGLRVNTEKTPNSLDWEKKELRTN